MLIKTEKAKDGYEEVVALFDKIIGAHPDSNYAERARQARGY